MEITIHELAKLANVSTRTLRYYDQIKLLIAKRNPINKIRYYTNKDVDLLQQICLYKQMNLPLKQIARIIHQPSFDELKALSNHLNFLSEQKAQLEIVIETVKKTIAYKKGEKAMSNQEKFNGLKEKMIQDNEKMYGEETRKRYGQKVVEQANEKMRKMTEDYDEIKDIENQFFENILIAFASQDENSAEAKKAALLHQRWITYFWKTYDAQAHINLAKMYTEDERFTAYYDKKAKGLTKFLYQIIQKHIK